MTPVGGTSGVIKSTMFSNFSIKRSARVGCKASVSAGTGEVC